MNTSPLQFALLAAALLLAALLLVNLSAGTLAVVLPAFLPAVLWGAVLALKSRS